LRHPFSENFPQGQVALADRTYGLNILKPETYFMQHQV